MSIPPWKVVSALLVSLSLLGICAFFFRINFLSGFRAVGNRLQGGSTHEIPLESIGALKVGSNGMTDKEVFAMLGPPDHRNGDTWYYTAEGGDTLKLDFMPAGYVKLLYFTHTIRNPAAWPQTDDLDAVLHGVKAGESMEDVRADFPHPEAFDQDGYPLKAFIYHHGKEYVSVTFFYSYEAYRGYGVTEVEKGVERSVN